MRGIASCVSGRTEGQARASKAHESLPRGEFPCRACLAAGCRLRITAGGRPGWSVCRRSRAARSGASEPDRADRHHRPQREADLPPARRDSGVRAGSDPGGHPGGSRGCRARGRAGGRPSAWTPEKLRTARAMYAAGEDVGSIAREPGRQPGVGVGGLPNDQGPTAAPSDRGRPDCLAQRRTPMRSSQSTMIGATTSACQKPCRCAVPV